MTFRFGRDGERARGVGQVRSVGLSPPSDRSDRMPGTVHPSGSRILVYPPPPSAAATAATSVRTQKPILSTHPRSCLFLDVLLSPSERTGDSLSLWDTQQPDIDASRSSAHRRRIEPLFCLRLRLLLPPVRIRSWVAPIWRSAGQCKLAVCQCQRKPALLAQVSVNECCFSC
ncbi:hypothetical protein PYCCODRAFT_1055086 [Trametes coccinea BRFM310]|uniref:Uncharacterized protein n=1 Tax=Trametes coccinea (strain BRFM310) TaxID=1353009 RepID=A0A1Y2IXM8_TRAC3|nr:hypothetical protein PYCCODRAFT_1055086 [Trametes coccinea BRFM310]